MYVEEMCPLRLSAPFANAYFLHLSLFPKSIYYINLLELRILSSKLNMFLKSVVFSIFVMLTFQCLHSI